MRIVLDTIASAFLVAFQQYIECMTLENTTLNMVDKNFGGLWKLLHKDNSTIILLTRLKETKIGQGL